MSHPTIEAAKAIAERYGLDRIVIYFQTGEGRNGYASYGKTKDLCDSTQKIAERMLHVAEESLENGRLSDETKFATYSGDGRCRSCDAAILWFKTPNGKNLPVNDTRDLCAQPLAKGDQLPWDRVRKHTHFETCPNAGQHRGHPG
jgi:hypothetical protein